MILMSMDDLQMVEGKKLFLKAKLFKKKLFKKFAKAKFIPLILPIHHT